MDQDRKEFLLVKCMKQSDAISRLIRRLQPTLTAFESHRSACPLMKQNEHPESNHFAVDFERSVATEMFATRTVNVKYDMPNVSKSLLLIAVFSAFIDNICEDCVADLVLN